MKRRKTMLTALLLAVSACLAQAETDFGNYSSETITGKAWKAMESKNYDEALIYINKCKELYEKKALEMQAELGDQFAEKGKEFNYWALNDVGTCYSIHSQILEKQGKKEEQIAVLRQLATKFPSCQCWDVKGWFWYPGKDAAAKLKKLEFDASL